MFSVSSVLSHSVLRRTTSASLNTPISFFNPPKFTPVLPPTLASTIASNVVGILIKLIPRLKVEAAKPPRSVTIPPPRFINSEWRVAPPCCNASHTEANVSSVLLLSVVPIVITCACFRQKSSLISSQHISRVVSSTSTKILSFSHSEMAVANSLLNCFDIIIFCLISFLL